MISTYILSHSLLAPLSDEVSRLKEEMGALGNGLLWSLLELLVATDELSLSADYATLSATLHCGQDDLRQLLEGYPLFAVTDGRVTCPLLTADMERHHARSIMRQRRARKAAAARWGHAPERDDATSMEDDPCTEHRSVDAHSTDEVQVSDTEAPNATRIPSPAPSRTCVRSRARGKRKNNIISGHMIIPEMANTPPIVPPSSPSAHESGARGVGSGAAPGDAALRAEVASLRATVDLLAAEVRRSRRQRSRSRGDGARTVASSGEEYIATLEEAWAGAVRDWVTYRSDIGAPIRGRLAVSKFYERLRQLSGGDIGSARRLIDRSIANGYKGIDLRPLGYVSSGHRRTDATGRVIDSTVGQDYSERLSIRDCIRLQAEGKL